MSKKIQQIAHFIPAVLNGEQQKEQLFDYILFDFQVALLKCHVFTMFQSMSIKFITFRSSYTKNHSTQALGG